MNDGLRISLTDYLGRNAHFYGFRHEPAMPKTGGGAPTLPNTIDTDDNGNTDIARSTTYGWSSSFAGYKNLKTLQIDYSGGGLNFIRGLRFSALGTTVEYPVDGGLKGYLNPDGFSTGVNEFYSFQIVGGDNAGSTSFSDTDAYYTLLYLSQAINASILDVTCTLSTEGSTST